MPNMTIQEAAQHLGVSKEAIHNRVRRGSLSVTVVDGVKLVNIDSSSKSSPSTKSRAQTRRSVQTHDDRYYKLLEEQNSKLQAKIERLEGETRSLRDQKEQMLIDERIKIERIYKEKDEQLKNILTSISSQFMLNAPMPDDQEEHLDAEIEVEPNEQKGELISLNKYLKQNGCSKERRKKIKDKFNKKAKKDERIISIDGKFYLDTIKYSYKDLL